MTLNDDEEEEDEESVSEETQSSTVQGALVPAFTVSPGCRVGPGLFSASFHARSSSQERDGAVSSSVVTEQFFAKY